MVSVLDSRTSCPDLSPGGGHCVVFLGKTLYSHSIIWFYQLSRQCKLATVKRFER